MILLWAALLGFGLCSAGHAELRKIDLKGRTADSPEAGATGAGGLEKLTPEERKALQEELRKAADAMKEQRGYLEQLDHEMDQQGKGSR